MALAATAIAVVTALGSYLTSPRPGGSMDPTATGPDGAHALVSLLRDHGVEVVVADTVAAVERSARPDALVLVAETARIADAQFLQRLARLPGDLLLVQPNSRARGVLAPAIRAAGPLTFSREPDCDLREARRAGSVDLGTAQTYIAAGDRNAGGLDSCYDGALVRYRTGDRTITVVGSASFMTNSHLLAEGNAALAMNLTGVRPRLIWYAPQHIEGVKASTATIVDLIPPNVSWMIWQLGLAVLLAAWWRGRRLGPLVSEPLPVVVRASETVEGLGRLYRSRRARGRAAAELRAAALQRLLPRVGLGRYAGTPPPAVVVAAIARHSPAPPESVGYLLFGPPPHSDTDLVHLARALDDIERQVTRR